MFVGRIELITPEATRAVTDAIAHADWSALDRYGRFLDPILARISAATPSLAKQADQARQKTQELVFSAMPVAGAPGPPVT